MKKNNNPLSPKTKNIYSALSALPKGRAKDNLVEGALVLEGGAFRGNYTSGVIDALMENDLNFELTLGCSAGAMNGYCYVGGVIGKAGRINLTYRHDPRYVGLDAYRRNKGIIGFDFLFQELEKKEPIYPSHFDDPKRRLLVVATCLEDGKAVYFEKGKYDLKKGIQASASMPYVSHPVEIDGKHYLDGGCACKVPYEEAIRQGAKKLVIVLTREKGYRKKEKKNIEFNAELVYGKKYKTFAEELGKVRDMTNHQYEEIDKLGEEGKAFVLYPSSPVNIDRLEPDMNKLGSLYFQGYHDALNALPALRAYLAK